MRRLPLVVLCSLMLVAGCGSKKAAATNLVGTEPSDPRIGQMAPPIELEDMQGKPFSLAAQKGKVVFLDFWATWCPPCQRSTPEVVKLEEDYGPRGVQIVSLSVDEDKTAVPDFVARHGMKNRVIEAGDSDVSQQYGVRGIPMFVLIDKEGKIAQIWTGFHPAMVPGWRSELDRLLKA